MPGKVFARVGEYGWLLEFATNFDASSGGPLGLPDSAKIYLRAPDGTETEHEASSDDPASGNFYFLVTAGLIDQTGEWQAILELEWEGEALLCSNVEKFRVGSRFSAS